MELIDLISSHYKTAIVLGFLAFLYIFGEMEKRHKAKKAKEIRDANKTARKNMRRRTKNYRKVKKQAEQQRNKLKEERQQRKNSTSARAR